MRPPIRRRNTIVIRVSAAVLLGFFAPGCTGVLSNPGKPGAQEGNPAALPSNGSPGLPPSSLTAVPGGPEVPGVPANNTDPFASCVPGATVAGPAPLARITTLEYRNTVLDLFPNIALPVTEYAFPGEVETEGFTNNAETQTPSAALIEALANNAHSIATLASSDLSKLLPCSPQSAAEERECGHRFVAEFGDKAYRGSLESADLARFTAFFDTAYANYGFTDAVRMLVETMLSSPKFLYRMEVGGAEQAGAIPLTSREMASRLSYFLTDSMPDTTLLQAAKDGSLADPLKLEAQARRLLTSQSARGAIAAFNSEWLRFRKMDALTKAPDVFPNFTAQTADSMRRATAQYVDHLFWDTGFTLDALLTDTHAYVDDQLAPIYGIAPGGSSGMFAELNAGQRAGVLTQAGLLAGFAHERNDAPVLRGIFVLDRFLCTTPPPPPPGVTTALPPVLPGQQLTTRQQLEQSHAAPACTPCHQAIDGIGFGFGKYDAIGQWRTTEYGVPVDDSGELKGTDVDGRFVGAVDLAHKLAVSPQVARCTSTQILRYALGVTRGQISPCMVKSIVTQFEAGGRDLRELLVALATSDAFRYRETN